MACVEACPVYIDPLSKILELRRNQVMIQDQLSGDLRRHLLRHKETGESLEPASFEPTGLGEGIVDPHHGGSHKSR